MVSDEDVLQTKKKNPSSSVTERFCIIKVEPWSQVKIVMHFENGRAGHESDARKKNARKK